MKTVINIADIQNGKQALRCLRFVYISHVSLFWFLILNDEYVGYYWLQYKQLIPLTQAQNAHACLKSVVVCALCSSMAFWSDVADARRVHSMSFNLRVF